MKKRFLPLLLCLALLLPVLTACGPAAPGAQEPADEPLQEPTTELNVYVADYFYADYLDMVTRQFRQSHPDVELNIVSVESSDGEEGQKLPVELAAGRGPDLYIGVGGEFKDLYKVLNTGAFCDLTQYLENMENFDRANYVEGVIDGALYRGKQYIIPLTWIYPGIVTTREALEEAGISPDELGTFSGLMRAAQKYSEANDGACAFFEKYDGDAFLLYADGLRPDYEALQVNVNTAEFREMIDAYKLIYAQEQARSYDFGAYYGESSYSLRNRNHLFTDGFETDFLGQSFPFATGIGAEFSFLTKDDTPLLIPIPTLEGKTLASIHTFAAVNANSPNKANAADFIGLLLQKEPQDQIGKWANPVCRELFEVRAKGLMHQTHMGGGVADEAGNVLGTWTNISQEEADQLLEALLHVDGVTRISNYMLQIVLVDMEPYFKDEQSYETCLQKLESDLTIYISE